MQFEVDVEIVVRTGVMLVGLACIYYAVPRMWRRRRIRRDPVRASGKVIGLDLYSSDEGPDWYTPTVRYAEENGATHEAQLPNVTDTKKYAVGKEVPIIYERGNPTNLVDPGDGRAEMIALSLIFVFGLTVVLFGALAEVVPAE